MVIILNVKILLLKKIQKLTIFSNHHLVIIVKVTKKRQKKAPAKSTEIFSKGLGKFSKEIVLGLNNLNRTMGSLNLPKIGEEIKQSEEKRVSSTLAKLKSGYEKFILSLVTMMNEQHSLVQS